MKITILGAGPAGLYAALLLKKNDPRAEIRVIERNPADATYGWGVVFSDRTLAAFQEADYTSYEAISESFVIWDTIAVRCLVDGKAVARQLVIAGGERDGQAIADVRARSDPDGVARFVLRAPGKWYIKFIHMIPVSGDSVNYESKWATLTFQVR